MAHTAIVGGGPAGLSAALFLAKNDQDVTVFDTDDTWMHSAHLFNYPGIKSANGEELLGTMREQADYFGAERVDEEVADVETTDGGFVVHADESHDADYLILATGADRDLAQALGCEFDEEDTVAVDVTMETDVADAYATGAMVRAEEWQAIISAGDGAAAALNVLTKEEGEQFHDFDTPGDVDDYWSE